MSAPATQRRVAVTGFGLISSLGNDDQSVAQSLREGRSGLASVPEWKQQGLRSWVAGRIDDDELRERSRLGRRALTTMGPVAALCALAAEQALHHAELEIDSLAQRRFGCIVGSGVGSMETIYEGARLVQAGRARRVRPHSILQAMSSAPSAQLVQAFGIGGRSYSISAACATSTNTIGHAFELIRSGVLDSILAGGGEEVNLFLAAAFSALRTALSSTFNDTPARASRPFDIRRDGFVLSGGAGILVLEEMEAARRRGAPIVGEVLGYGANSEAFDPILPEPRGIAASECMKAAIRDAGLEPTDIDYVNAHATGTASGDLAEVRALNRVFGDRLPPFSSTKGLGGHALGAAGAHEAIHCLAMMNGAFLAPTANLEQLDPEIEFAPALSELVERQTEIHLSNSFGFGGSNACLVLARADRAG